MPAQTTTLALFWNRRMFGAKAAELRAAGLDPERCHFEERPLLPEVHGELSARMTTYINLPPAPEHADPDQPDARAPRTAHHAQQ